MKKMLTGLLIFSLLFTTYAFAGFKLFKKNSNTNKGDSGLQSACSEQAAAYSKQHLSNSDTSHCTCHYNSRLNKCFLRQPVFDNTIRQDGAIVTTNYDTVRDVNNNKVIANFSQTQTLAKGLWTKSDFNCTVRGQSCSSKVQYDRLVKPYMEG